jgi:hypothetical protein
MPLIAAENIIAAANSIIHQTKLLQPLISAEKFVAAVNSIKEDSCSR